MASPVCTTLTPAVTVHSATTHPPLEKLRQPLEDKDQRLQGAAVEKQQHVFCEEDYAGGGRGGGGGEGGTEGRYVRQTEEELASLHKRLTEIRCRRQLLTSKLWNLRERNKREVDKEVNRKCLLPLQQSSLLSVSEEVQVSIPDLCGRLEELDYQEDALSALRSILKQDLERHRDLEQAQNPEQSEDLEQGQDRGQRPITERVPEEPNRARDIRAAQPSMHGKSEMELENNTQNKRDLSKPTGVTSHPRKSSLPNHTVLYQSTRGDELVWRSHFPPSRTSNLSRSTSVKNLTGRASDHPGSGAVKGPPDGPVPSITVTPPLKDLKSSGDAARKTAARKTAADKAAADKMAADQAGKTEDGPGPDSGSSRHDSGLGSLSSEPELDSSKQPDSPASEEELATPRGSTPGAGASPKFHLLDGEQGIGFRAGVEVQRGGGSVGENGPRLAPWETARLGPSHYRGSLESLASRDWDTMSERLGGFDSPPRVFQSPYATPTSMDFNPSFRMSEFKQGGMSPATSEMNLYSFNSRSTSPVHGNPLTMGTRSRFSTYDTLRRRPEITNTVGFTQQVHMPLRSATLGAPNKRDYIDELTKQMDVIQKRNTFLEAESVEMEKERNQIRYEMRGLLVNNEDLLRTNTQLTNDSKRMRDHMMEIEREQQAMAENYRQMEVELKETRDLMVEANTQEYAFNFLQQSLKNKLQDAEENLEKQTQHAQTMAEKMWLAERQVEELELDRETRDKRTSDLSNTISRLEEELGEAILISSQTGAELNLQQKLREDVQVRVEELEESLLEKDQELQRVQSIVIRLQGEVSGKLIDKERTLEEEIQQRERLQLQCKQAERTVEDLHMELQTANQSREDLSKQLKIAQEKMIDLETDLEEVHDSEQRWAAKHKRTIEQMDQLQQKIIQEQHLSEQLESDKVSMERQLRGLRLEVDELQSSRVQEDVISRSEGRVKELENALRAEERNKLVLSNNVGKLERKIGELSDQMEEEHRISTEQKDLMTQRIRALKRQLNEAEEETGRKEAQYRHAQRELAEERESAGRLQRQLLDQHLQTKRKETMMMRQTLENLRLDLSVDDDEPLEGELAIV